MVCGFHFCSLVEAGRNGAHQIVVTIFAFEYDMSDVAFVEWIAERNIVVRYILRIGKD